MGRLLPGVQTRITDGELFVKPDHPPYLHADHPDRYVDGWLRTYDHAEIDQESGVLRLLGRADSVLNIGGLKVDLTEIESILRDHHRVNDALAFCRATEAGQDGAPPMLEAYIATAESVTSEELTEWCRERLSAYKVPRRWHIGADIPRTTQGKAARGTLPADT
ncbi:AMP-binding enzyme [Saccharopolyspora pogona]|uniref:AMP-binding enzyme n=1 Tax=Saccharopolyspora pogona TaxID=333966 RepID=UPI001CC232EF|nr:hypothetical protein [Saccharopolyspora pogona]